MAERLSDAPRPGAPGKFTPEQVCAIIALACEAPKDSGLPISQTGSSPYVWQSPALATQERGVITITGVLTTVLPARYELANTATITSKVEEVYPHNNVDVAVVTVPNNAPVAARCVWFGVS